MAEANSARETLLSDLQIPDSVLDVFKQCGIGLFELLTLSIEELRQYLEQTDVQWKIPVVFDLIDSWRKRNKTKILSAILNVNLPAPKTEDPLVKFEIDILEENEPPSQLVSDESFGSSAETIEPKSENPENETVRYEAAEAVIIKESISPDVENDGNKNSAEVRGDDEYLPEVEEHCSRTSDATKKLANIAETPTEVKKGNIKHLREEEEHHDGAEIISIGVTATTAPPPNITPLKESIQAAVNNTGHSRDQQTVFSPKVLELLLSNTEEGKELIERAKLGELSEAKQLQLAGIIAKYHLRYKKKLLTDDLENYALTVVTLFKFERKENYYIARSGDRRNHGGKIANKIGNLKQKKRKSEAKEEEHVKQLKITVSCPVSLTPMSNAASEWLSSNNEPWTAVLENWAASFEVRKQYLQSTNLAIKLMTKFPHYKSPYGYQLVDIDFRRLYPDTSYGLPTLDRIKDSVISYISKKALDPSATKLLEHLTNSETNDDSKLCALLLGLNTVLPPVPAGLRYKPTICLAQEDTIIFAESHTDAVLKVKAIYSDYAARKFPVVPKLVVVGKNLTDISGKFLVYYSDICYELQSAKRAVDVVIKLTAVLGLPHSKISKLVWQQYCIRYTPERNL